MTETQPQRPGSSPADGAPGATVARNAFHLAMGQVATTVLAIAMSATLGRLLGAQEFGLLYLLTTMSAFAYVFAEWGLPLFVIRQVARDRSRSGALLGTALALRFGLAIAAMVPVALIAWLLGYGARTATLAVLLILSGLPLALAQAYGMLFRAHDRMDGDAALSVSNKAIALLVALPALSLGMGIPGMVLAQAVAGAGALVVAARLYRRLGAGPIRVDRATARELIVGGVPILATTGVISFQPYLDALILSRLAPAVAVGWFGAAKTILGTLTAPATILGAAAYPRIARVAGDTAALRREIRSVLRPLLWLAALAGTGTYLFAEAAIGLVYGLAGFAPAATILKVFAPGLFLLFIDILLGGTVYACGRATGFAAVKIVSVVAAAGMEVVLIPMFQERYGNGGIGVVVAFALCELIVFAGSIALLPRRTFAPAVVLDVGRALASAGATIVLFRLIPALPAWAGIPLCIGAFAAASAALGLSNRADLEMLLRLIRGRIAKVSQVEDASGP